MHRLLGGKGTAPPGVPETPLVARHGAALATMALNMKQTEDPPSVSEILERRLQAQAEAVHNRLAFVKQLDMGMGKDILKATSKYFLRTIFAVVQVMTVSRDTQLKRTLNLLGTPSL